jgi:NAD(P)-dependent dehydrogenase (short-subunit alcohol dehydrogenase family)
MQKLDDLRGKGALVTGAADGIGLALAEALSPREPGSS